MKCNDGVIVEYIVSVHAEVTRAIEEVKGGIVTPGSSLPSQAIQLTDIYCWKFKSCNVSIKLGSIGLGRNPV